MVVGYREAESDGSQGVTANLHQFRRQSPANNRENVFMKFS
jgi:hypothetical protein